MAIKPYPQAEERLVKSVSEIAKTFARIQSDAVLAYTPLVQDICHRKATEEEVDHLLSNLLSYVTFEPMLELFKKVCRAYILTYPNAVEYYVLECMELLEEKESEMN